MPAKFGDSSITNEWKTAEPAAQLSRGAWWKIYTDAELDRLETLAASNNQQIALAVANYDQARAAVKVAQANFFPQISANPSATRQRTSANASSGGSNSGSRIYNTFNVSADASWELDFFGRIRRQTESARAQFAASAEDLESLKLSIQAEVAMDYFTLRSLDAQSESLSQTAVAYQRALELTQNRRKAALPMNSTWPRRKRSSKRAGADSGGGLAARPNASRARRVVRPSCDHFCADTRHCWFNQSAGHFHFRAERMAGKPAGHFRRRTPHGRRQRQYRRRESCVLSAHFIEWLGRIPLHQRQHAV